MFIRRQMTLFTIDDDVMELAKWRQRIIIRKISLRTERRSLKVIGFVHN